MRQSTNTEIIPTTGAAPAEERLTQKEYLIAIRNRLFSVEEQIWLHEYAVARPGILDMKVEPLSEEKYDSLVRARGDLLDEYPVTRLHTDLYDCQSNNLTYAALLIERLIGDFNRQLPLSMEHINQIAVLSYSGQVINLMRGQGLVYHRLLPSNTMSEPGVKRQFQHPSFSSTGKYLALAEMHFRDDGTFVRSNAIVYEVPKDPKKYGSSDSMPLFDSGKLPGAPFFMRFSPNQESLAMLCSSPTDPSQTSLLLLDWGKFFRKDSWAGQASMSRFTPRTTLTLLTGNPLYLTYTTSNAKNATIVAHSLGTVTSTRRAANGLAIEKGENDVEESKMTERAVWMLQQQDTGGVRDYTWKKISSSSDTDKWSAPVCHSAGGGDNVLVVEDGYLVSKALSRWKRSAVPNEDGTASYQLASKKLMQVSNIVL